MKKMFLLVSALLLVSMLTVTVCAEPKEEIDTKILNLFKNTVYKNDPGIKVLEANFKKVSTDKYADTWKVDLKLKNCYTVKVECSSKGRFKTTDNEYGTSFWSVFYGHIDKQGESAENVSKGIIKVLKDKNDIFASFEITTECDPVFGEHSSPADKNFRKQYLPKNNECKSKK